MISAMPRIAIAVHDFEAAVTMFRETFGMPVIDLSDMTVPDLGAHVGMCVPPGGSNIELMAPATPGAPLATALQKFLDRRGEGLYALMLEAPDPNAEAADIGERGLEVLPLMEGAGGRDLHPRSTHGVLIRIYPDNSIDDQGPHEEREPYLTGITKLIIAVTDANKAAKVYGDGLGLMVADAVDDYGRGVAVATVHPPKGGMIELVSPSDTAKPFARRIMQVLTESGQGMFALVLESRDSERAIATLRDRGVDFAEPEGFGPETTVHGARLLIE